MSPDIPAVFESSSIWGQRDYDFKFAACGYESLELADAGLIIDGF
jgi:hypothetical protein